MLQCHFLCISFAYTQIQLLKTMLLFLWVHGFVIWKITAHLSSIEHPTNNVGGCLLANRISNSANQHFKYFPFWWVKNYNILDLIFISSFAGEVEQLLMFKSHCISFAVNCTLIIFLLNYWFCPFLEGLYKFRRYALRL